MSECFYVSSGKTTLFCELHLLYEVPAQYMLPLFFPLLGQSKVRARLDGPSDKSISQHALHEMTFSDGRALVQRVIVWSSASGNQLNWRQSRIWVIWLEVYVCVCVCVVILITHNKPFILTKSHPVHFLAK